MRAWVCMLLCAAAASQASAAERRIALLVAHPFGGDGLLPLRYTAHDIERVREVLERWGGFAPSDVLVSFGEDADAVLERFAQAHDLLASATEDETLFVFYYSGHAKDGELRLGDSRLPLLEVKRLTESTPARIRLAVIDACRAGSITRTKGATKGAPIEVALERPTGQSGQVLITASSDDEDAQESDAIQGSFFTYYFTSGLRGAADHNGDGVVSLAEAYQHAYASTVLSTVGTRGGVQHPTYHFDLRGAGELVLTRVAKLRSGIVFPPAAEGSFVVFDLGRKVVVAELTKERNEPVQLAVAPGRYVVKQRRPEHLLMQKLNVGDGQLATVDLARMERVAFADDYAKGAVVTLDEVRFGKTGLLLAASAGAQRFLSAPARSDYFPDLGLLTVQLDVTNLFRYGMGLRLDVGVGASGERALVLDDPYVGEVRYDVQVSQLTAGGALAAYVTPVPWLRLGGQVRLGFILVSRRFVGAELPAQSFSTLTPGLGAEAAIRLTDWLTAGVVLRAHYMFFNVDAPMSLAYVDGALVLTTVLR